MNVFHLFLTILLCSIAGFGGMGALPVLRAQLSPAIPNADALILHGLAVGNVSPGPNGLYLVAVSYLLDGLPGALVATAAILLPPLMVFLVSRLRDALTHSHRFRATMRSLSFAVLALYCTSSASLIQHASTSRLGLVMVVGGAAMLFARAPAVLAVACAIAVGLLV